MKIVWHFELLNIHYSYSSVQIDEIALHMNRVYTL